ncbi:MAG: SusD/RagB family nutrient-binding outer membrane lipoprotein, partial [Balneolales bacterium]
TKTNLDEGNASGVVQHMQEDGWYTRYNNFQWGAMDWNDYYDLLRNNKFVYDKAVENDEEFLQGISLTLKSLIYGQVTDLWGDAPYSEALKSGDAENTVLTPKFDKQEDIYRGVIADLKSATSLFESVNSGGSASNPGQSDILFNGDVDKWHSFANSLILRYSMRLSEKLPDFAKDNIENVYTSGIYLKDAGDDVSIAYNDADIWLNAEVGTDPTFFRRRKFANTLLDKLVNYNDPRLEVFVAPVHVQWVEDPTLTVDEDEFIRENGEILDGVVSYTDKEFFAKVAAGNKYTRHFNPLTSDVQYDTREYVGLEAGMLAPDTHNGNPTPGQTVQNQHVSQRGDIFRNSTHELLQSRIITAAEVHFILAEAAHKGWNTGSAENHYKAGVQQALNVWAVGDQYDEYIIENDVAYDGTLEQIIEQKYIAAFSMASEAWFDYRRTGYPELVAGPATLQEPAIPLRYQYGENEMKSNSSNLSEASERLETTSFSTVGANSSWSKPWVLQGTGQPW